MAFRVKLAARALRQIGKAHDWYELQRKDLGSDFIASLEQEVSQVARSAVDQQIRRVIESPVHFAEISPRIRRAVLNRFPYALFFTIKQDLIFVLAVLHHARNPKRWPVQKS